MKEEIAKQNKQGFLIKMDFSMHWFLHMGACALVHNVHNTYGNSDVLKNFLDNSYRT